MRLERTESYQSPLRFDGREGEAGRGEEQQMEEGKNNGWKEYAPS